MKAVVLQGFGTVDNLVLQDVPVPTPRPGQVVVRVRATGLNYAEVLWRLERYPGCKVPHILGFEIAGEVAELGPGVHTFKVGDRVFGFNGGGGGNAEYSVANAETLWPIPEHISDAEAASIPVVWGTVYHGLHTFGQVSEGENVLIHAAGGGVGTIAVQWAKALGATVFGTAGSDEKLERVRELGADHVINYRTQDFMVEVKRVTDGVDVVLDSIGGQVLDTSIKLMRPWGRCITFGFASGERGAIDPYRLFAKNQTLAGLYLGRMAPKRVAEAMEGALHMLRGGLVKPVVGHVFSLEQVAAAHSLMEGRGSFGKIVITI